MFNFNIEIYVKKPKLSFWNKYLTNFVLASMFSTYENIIDNFNIQNILILEEIVHIFYTKKTKLTNLGVIQEESTYFAT